jgi:hypothetical protein
MRARLCLVVVFCLLAGISAVAQTGIFVEPPQYPLGSYSPAAALGDSMATASLIWLWLAAMVQWAFSWAMEMVLFRRRLTMQ